MIVTVAEGCWVHDDDLARLLDDGCPHTQEEQGRSECPNCMGTYLATIKVDGLYKCSCPDCGEHDTYDLCDLYGCMGAGYGWLY